MDAVFIRYRWLTGALVAVVVLAAAFGIWSRWITAEPLNASLTLSPPGRVLTDVSIRLPCPHMLGTHLSSGTRTRDEMRRLAGQYGTTEGIDIPLQWSFLDATGQVVASGKAENVGSHASDATGFSRSASEWLPLSPRTYRLNAAITRELAGLEDISARMYLRCHPKVSTGWQTDLLFFGSFVWLLAWPLAAGLALLLAVLAARERGHTGAAS